MLKKEERDMDKEDWSRQTTFITNNTKKDTDY